MASARKPSKPNPKNQGTPLAPPAIRPPTVGTNTQSQPGAQRNAYASTTKGQMTRGSNPGAH